MIANGSLIPEKGKPPIRSNHGNLNHLFSLIGTDIERFLISGHQCNQWFTPSGFLKT